MAMECGGNKVAETRKKVVMEWNAMVMKLKKQEKKLQRSGMQW
jgi:hypothetical protein